MEHPRRRLALTLAGVAALVVVSALLYMAGMARLEGRPRGFWDSLEWAAETLTTTGYGADAHWTHPAMVLFVVGVQFAGVFLVFLIVPLFLIPFLESRFEVRLPKEMSEALVGHVVIYRYGPAVETLLAELAAARVPTLLLESDDGAARRLFEAGQRVLHRPLDDAALRAADLRSSRALIANGSDDANAALILAARQSGFTGPILALVEEPFHRRPMMLAGASAVFTPRHILGAALAARASARIDPRLASAQQLGRQLAVAEVQIEPQSRLAGRTLAEAAIGATTGATVIGQWLGGELHALPEPEARLQAESVLVVAGSPQSVERVGELARAAAPARRGPFVVGGYGEVGRKVVELLLAVGEEVRVIDRRAAPGVDLVGNVIDPGILEAAGAAEAQAVILALDTDSATLFATVILKDAVPAVPVIARVNQAENVDRIHRAGAYFALSISQVSGQMLARKLLGEEAVAVDPHLMVLRVPAAELRGATRRRARSALSGAEVRRRTGCSVIAVERGEEVLIDLPAEVRFGPDDVLYVCGSAAAVRRFPEALG
ncbi:MAG TPA: NAD-binding protein [Thermoanaerobaculia bacterium]